MRLILVFVFLLLAACSTLNESQLATNTERYNTLVAELKNTVQPSAVVEARGIYLDTEYALQLDLEAQLISNIQSAIESTDWQTCLAHSDKLLSIHYTNLFAHYGAMVCQFELHKPEESRYHQQMINTILEAFWQTGDGEQIDTSFFAINEQDLKAFIEFHGLELRSQTRLTKIQGTIVQADVYDSENDEHFTWFFRLAIPS